MEWVEQITLTLFEETPVCELDEHFKKEEL